MVSGLGFKVSGLRFKVVSGLRFKVVSGLRFKVVSGLRFKVVSGLRFRVWVRENQKGFKMKASVFKT
jgi:ribosomal protein S12